jgi:hypothetical protein
MVAVMKFTSLVRRVFIAGATWSALTLAQAAETSRLQEGDIVFSSSKRGQGEAIIAATGSPYTHCGIVFEKDGKMIVLEAVQPVGIVSLERFISLSEPGTFTAKRLKTTVTPALYQKARTWAQQQMGRNYDARFLWDDTNLYCSELVWKIYQKAGVELCPPRKFRDYDLEKPAVKKIIQQRFGGMDRVPMDEKVVAPSDIAGSAHLMEIKIN